MYKVELYEYGQTPITVLDFNNRIQYLSSCSLDKQEDSIDSVSMTINHQFISEKGIKIKPFKTLCKVTNTKKNKVEFIGRVLSPEETMGDSGASSHNYVFEGALAFLGDTIQKYSFEFDKLPIDNLNLLLNMHNTEVSASGDNYKRVYVRNCDVQKNVIPNDGGYHEEEMYFKRWEDKDTLATINEDLIGKYGGHIVVDEYTDNGIYIDYIKETGVKKMTEIVLGKNLKSFQRKIDPSEVITRVKPLGSSSETANGDEIRLTIADVNNGSPYIDIPELIEIYGIQTGILDLPEKYTPITLKEETMKWIEEQKKQVAKVSISLDALDLSLIGLDPDDFDLFNIHHTVCPIFNIDEDLKIIGINIDLMNPQNKSITIGEKQLTLQDVQRQENIKVTNTIITNEVPNIIQNEVPAIVDTSIKEQVPTLVDKGVNDFKTMTFDPYKATVPELINSKISDFKNYTLGQVIENTIDTNKNEIYNDVVNKINSSPNVLKADALQVDSAMINKVVSSDILTNRLVGDSAFITNLMASNIVSDKIKTTSIDLNRATVRGDVNSSNYLILTNDEISQYGTYDRVDRQTYETETVSTQTQIKNGNVRFRNINKGRSLYFNDYGIRTNNTDASASGLIQFFHQNSAGKNGIYIYGGGDLRLEAGNKVYSEGEYVALNARSDLNLTASANIKFWGGVYEFDSNGALYVNSYINQFKNPIQADLQSRNGSNNCYIRTPSEVRVTNLDGYNGGSITYNDLRCQNIYSLGTVNYGTLKSLSSEKYKDNIEKWDIDASDEIRRTELYSYNYTSDLEKGDLRKRHGVIIERETPEHIIIDDGIDMNEITFTLYKSLKEQIIRNDKLEERLNKLEEIA